MDVSLELFAHPKKTRHASKNAFSPGNAMKASKGGSHKIRQASSNPWHPSSPCHTSHFRQQCNANPYAYEFIHPAKHVLTQSVKSKNTRLAIINRCLVIRFHLDVQQQKGSLTQRNAAPNNRPQIIPRPGYRKHGRS